MPSNSRALEGLRVLVLRPERQAEGLSKPLEELGATPVVVAAIEILPPQDPRPIDKVLSEPEGFDWLVFTSVNGVVSIASRLGEACREFFQKGVPLAAIGPATASALEELGATDIWLPRAFTTEALAAELPTRSSNEGSGRSRVCLFRADVADGLLESELSSRGFDVERVNAYHTQSVNASQIRKATKGATAVALTSASIVDSLASAVTLIPEGLRLYSIGPATSRACAKHGFKVTAEAKIHTVEGLVTAIVGDQLN